MNRTGLEAVVKRRWLVAILTLTVASGLPLRTHAELPPRYQLADLKALQQAFMELAEKVRPSVVAIRTYNVRDPQSPGARYVMRPHSQGSGFIIDGDGYVATNRHVIADADVISVVLNNGMKFEATVVQTDTRSDLAVLKIDAEDLKVVTFGDLSVIRVNQWVFACGNPFGLANDNGGASVTYGAVSALGRQMTQRLVGESDVEYYGNMIETSATINPGNSGGPLFNVDGEVVGIVAAIETTSGVSEGHGFAIPIDKNTRRILDALQAGREIRYGFLGVMVQDVEPPRSSLVVDSRVHRGVELRSISFSNGPAAQAGLKPRDVVIEYDGVPVEGADHFVRLVGFTPVGTEVPVVFLRNGVKRKTVVAVGDRSEMLSRAERTD